MKTKFKKQRGAVLIVALIMLSMVTFLVVAFVGFSRFERASVTASMVRTEAGHALEIGLLKAQQEVMEQIGNNINRGLIVSQNEAGKGTVSVPTSKAELESFASKTNLLDTQPRPPVYIDKDGDGIHETFPFYLDLNGALHQPTTNSLGVIGDPHWIGLLENPSQPHGPGNKFVARYAYLTVPAHKALNIRYNHNDLKRIDGNIYYDRFNREQGNHPQEINLAAPLWMIHPGFFKYEYFSPYSLKKSSPPEFGSAYSFASAFNIFGHEIEDAMHLSRPSKGYNELLNINLPAEWMQKRELSNNWTIKQYEAVHLDALRFWLNSINPMDPKGVKRMATPPYSYYQFMQLFSSTPLPAETEKFDVNSIHDETVSGYSIVDPVKDEVEFLRPHGLKSGDKVEPMGVMFPSIYDPIEFNLETSDAQGITSAVALKSLAEDGRVETKVPHRLVTGEGVEFIPVGTTPIQPLIIAGKDSDGNDVFWPLTTVDIVKTGEYTLQLQINQTPANTVVGWGVRDPKTKRWVRSFSPDPVLDNGDLPAIFNGVGYALKYRYRPNLPLDDIPYFVKVIDPTTVSLHRSAELDNYSKVNFSLGSTIAMYAYQPNTGLWKRQPGSQRFTSGKVRFLLQDGQPGPKRQQGPEVTGEEVFQVVYDRNSREIFLHEPGGNRLLLANGGTYRLQALYEFRNDRLGAAMERMAGLMLNESLDTTGDGPDGPLPDFHSLGGQTLPKENDPANPKISNPPFPFKMGIGGHQKSLGPWHQPQKGIPWGRGSASPFLRGNGRYTREMERIVQVAANITDLYSGYGGPNIPFAGDEVLTCNNLAGGMVRYLLPFGRFSRDARVSARIGSSNAEPYVGMVLCMRTDQNNPANFPAFEVRCFPYGSPLQTHVGLWIWAANPDGSPERVAMSSGLGPLTGDCQLQAECEGGRIVTVKYNDQEVLRYEHPQPLIGQSALLTARPLSKVTFTDLKPGVMPAALAGPHVKPNIWSYSTRTGASNLPTAWRGVFRRDEGNNLYLTGFQRWQTDVVGRNESPATSWYQRDAPMIIGVKDRHPTIPGAGLAPAITEISMRTVYDRATGGLFGRLHAEVHLPGQLSRSYYAKVRANVEDINYSLIYTDRAGGQTTAAVTATPGAKFVTVDISLDEGSVLHHSFPVPPANNASKPYNRLIGNIPLSNGQGGSLTNIRIDSMTLHVEGQIIRANSSRKVVDYLKGRLSLSRPVNFANVDRDVIGKLNVLDRGLNEWPQVPDWKAADDYGQVGNAENPRRVISNNAFYALRVSGLPGNPKNKPPSADTSNWMKLPWDVRMLDLSWQVNDPLVNSHGSDFTQKAYVPLGFPLGPVIDNKGTRNPVAGSNNPLTWVRRHWLPINQLNKPIYGTGVNLSQHNHASRPWTMANVGDSAIQDPGVGYSSPLSHLDWRFPDISRGRIKNVGWLGQVHRGTPWQTLYLKSKVPGEMEVTGYNHLTGEVTVDNHGIYDYDNVRLIGKCPPEWSDTLLANPVKVDSNANILEGLTPPQLEGIAERVDANIFRIQPFNTTKGQWQPGADELLDIGVATTIGLKVQKVDHWPNWAGSLDTLPANDRRLLEVFSVGVGVPIRGRFSINNDSNSSWSAVLSGLSVPFSATGDVGGIVWHDRILGANDPNETPYPFTDRWGNNRMESPSDRDARINLLDDRWMQIFKGIKSIRGTNTFTRVTDILAAPQLSDRSPYLPVVWGKAKLVSPGFQDELDLERIPMQLLSLLRVDDQPVYETYIYVQRLRSGFRVTIPEYSGPAISADGTILNYEVAGQSARRVVYKLSGAKAWHQSIKNGIPGKWRDREGKLRPLAPMRPIILHSSTL